MDFRVKIFLLMFVIGMSAGEVLPADMANITMRTTFHEIGVMVSPVQYFDIVYRVDYKDVSKGVLRTLRKVNKTLTDWEENVNNTILAPEAKKTRLDRVHGLIDLPLLRTITSVDNLLNVTGFDDGRQGCRGQHK